MDQKTAVITAGASGIGLAMAQAFLKEGYAVAVLDFDADAIEKTKENHPSIVAYHANVTDEMAVKSVFDDLQSQWGRIDCVMANAGIAGPASPLEDIALEDWKACIGVNVDGAFLTLKYAIPIMKARQSGSVILTSSTAGLFGYPYRSPYSAAKWAVTGMMKTLAMELGPFNIRVNSICPGAVEGDRMDRVIANESKARGIPEEDIRTGYEDCVSMRSFVSADDIANMALFLASDAARLVSGMSMAVDGHTEKITS